ncbi:MAG: NAD-binding protein [bacterium]
MYKDNRLCQNTVADRVGPFLVRPNVRETHETFEMALMKFSSKLLKIILSFSERYRLVDIVKIVLFLIIIWVVGATWLYFTEKDYQPTPEEILRGEVNYFDSYPHAYKNILVYLFSGFEEYIPHTFAGWLGSVLVMLFGSLGLVAILIGNVVSIIQEHIKEAKLIKKKPAYSHFQDHFVICNWGEKGLNILRQIRDESTRFTRPVVIVAEQAEAISIDGHERIFKDVWAVGGDPTRAEILKKADMQHAATALILAGTPSSSDGNILNHAPTIAAQAATNSAHAGLHLNQTSLIDAKTILIGMTIDALSQDTYTCVELLDARNKIHLQRTHIDEVISVEEFTFKLLAQACISHGLTHVYQHLLTASLDTNEFYKLAVPDTLVGKTYREVKKVMRALPDDFILLGYERPVVKGVLNHYGGRIATTKVVLNPRQPAGKRSRAGKDSQNYKLTSDDKLVLMAYSKPDVSKIEVHANGEE